MERGRDPLFQTIEPRHCCLKNHFHFVSGIGGLRGEGLLLQNVLDKLSKGVSSKFSYAQTKGELIGSGRFFGSNYIGSGELERDWDRMVTSFRCMESNIWMG